MTSFSSSFQLRAFAELQHLLRHRLVVDGPLHAVADRGDGKVQDHLHGHQQALRLGPLLLRDPDTIIHLQINNRNL